MLLVDLPPEEADGLRAALTGHGIALILLASPTTTDTRMAGDHLRAIRAGTGVPVMAGFGIKDAASAAAMSAGADGVVVGSALVAALGDAADPVAAAGLFLAPLRSALDATA